jgi:hypothetical protein
MAEAVVLIFETPNIAIAYYKNVEQKTNILVRLAAPQQSTLQKKNFFKHIDNSSLIKLKMHFQYLIHVRSIDILSQWACLYH